MTAFEDLQHLFIGLNTFDAFLDQQRKDLLPAPDRRA